MFSKQPSKKPSAEELELDRLMQAYQQKIEQLEQTAKGSIRESNTLPPMERIQAMKQQSRLNVAISKGNTANLKREMKNNALLLLLLIFAIATASAFAVHLLNQI